MKTMKVLLLVVCGVVASVICFKIADVMGQSAPQKQDEIQAPAKRSPAAGQKRQMSSAEKNKQIDQRLTRLDKYLKLTPVQKKDIRSAMEKNQPEMEKIQEQMRQLQEQMRKIMTRTEEQIKAALTPEQKKKYEILQDISPQRTGGGPGGETAGPGGGGGPGEMGGPEEEIETVP